MQVCTPQGSIDADCLIVAADLKAALRFLDASEEEADLTLLSSTELVAELGQRKKSDVQKKFEGLKVGELNAILQEAGLHTEGKKAEKVGRLLRFVSRETMEEDKRRPGQKRGRGGGRRLGTAEAENGVLKGIRQQLWELGKYVVGMNGEEARAGVEHWVSQPAAAAAANKLHILARH